MQKSRSKQEAEKNAGKKWLKYLPAIVVAVVVCIVLVVALFFKNLFHIEKAEQKKQIQQITMVTPPPPPPPPPPPEEQIKEPEPQIEEAKPEAESPPDQAQDSNDEALPEQDPNSSGEGPSLRAGTGGGRGPGGGGYEQVVRQEINEAIVDNARLKRMEYVAVINLKVADNGDFEQFDIEIISGDAEVKSLLEDVLRKKKRMSKARPLEAASLVKLRVKSVL